MRFAPSLQLSLARYPLLAEWLQLLGNLGRAHATLDAYARGVSHFLAYCEAASVAAEAATLADLSLYIRSLREGTGRIANSSLHQRLSAIRLWYDHLIYQGVRSTNPLPRGHISATRHVPEHAGFSRGLVPRLIKLPRIPTEPEWERLLAVAAGDTLRNRLMLALQYYGALRREELVSLRVSDLDFAHRLVSLRAETTKSKRARIVAYSPEVAPTLILHLHAVARIDGDAGPLFRSQSDRNRGAPLSIWSWSKIVARWAADAGIENFSTHSLRHLRLTHLARAGWRLHELSTYAGHADPKTTMVYLHIAGTDLSRRMAQSVGHIDARIGTYLFGSFND
ncbi:integrase [Sphingobium yanoikuyae]|uniref:Integrase n=1 Tax=Sphingobium yanoikuyae TaxID=13690 RepID=A0A177JJS8_SPHYA|nr:tyrosine-type recombinase/integrase [Sphingobium yanoikuyae]OAH41472.1 integrase [Sphingobium yanoikuyae]